MSMKRTYRGPGWRSPGTILLALLAAAVVGVVLNVLSPRISPELFDGLLRPFDMIAEIFMRLLRMLVAPLVLFSIMAGVAGIGNPRDLGRIGARTFLYYLSTSCLAILTGLLLVNLIRPGVGADLSLPPAEIGLPGEAGDLLGIFSRMVPSSIFQALAELDMLQIITFGLLAGFALTQLPARHRQPLTNGINALFELMIRLAHIVLWILPIAVFSLVVRIAARSEGGEILDLGRYFLTVSAGLAVHALITLPLILIIFARVSPRRWAMTVSRALMTAFTTSSSSATLPITLELVEREGKVKNEVSSFVLPLGSTINMDGTALYQCVAALFIAQFYAGASGYELTIARQLLVVLTALLASVGAAGIPSAGLVTMAIILQALNLPLEGALLVLVVDRPLDMLRTSVNVWSDTVGAAVVGRMEGSPPFGEDPPHTRDSA